MTASAQSIEPGNTFSVTLRALPNQMDLDIFRVMVDRDAVLTVQYANTESDPHRPSLRWLDKTGQLIGEGRTDLWVPAGSEVLLEFSTSAPARSGGLRFSSFEPRLVMTYTSDRYEPNDSIDTASVLAVGRRIAAELNVSDVDHFRLVLSDAGTYVADIDQLNGLILQWTDANGRVLSRVRQLVLSSPGPVLLRVALQPNNRGGSTPYSLQVLKIGGDPTLEPGMYPRYPPPLKVKQLSDLIQ